MSELKTKFLALLASLNKSYDLSNTHVLVWPDGFIDEIFDVVDTRLSSERYTRINTIGQFAKRINAYRERSGSIELVLRIRKYGGNAPYFAGAISNFGVPTTLIGCLGHPEDGILPLFNSLKERCQLITIAEPAYTEALEFKDGKIFLGRHKALHNVTWQRILKWVRQERLHELIEKTILFVQVNWAMLPHLDKIWRHLIQDIFPSLTPRLNGNRRQMFIDLCDPTKRGQKALQTALHIISDFQDYFDVTLGLNENEATRVTQALSIPFPSFEAWTQIANQICSQLSIRTVTIHRTKEAVACEHVAGKEVLEKVDGFYTQSPLILTGGGDHFNAGFCLGVLCNWPLKSRLLTGVAASGAYVRTGESPRIQDLAKLVKNTLP
ncbi:MAG: PfkB family carbohydrate kinase [Candidatus Ranarchaeia archaeon]